MPVYCFVCPKCGRKAERLRQMKDSALPEICPRGCKQLRPTAPESKFVEWEYVPMRRDLQSEQLGSTGNDFDKPILSESMGVAPSQVAEHRRLHPDIPLTADGRVILRSHGERKRIMRKLGFYDKDGYA